jgi:hypothetical protein
MGGGAPCSNMTNPTIRGLCILQGISDGMSCAVNEARLAVDVGYWPLYRYTPETDLPSTTDEVSLRGKGWHHSHVWDMHVLAVPAPEVLLCSGSGCRSCCMMPRDYYGLLLQCVGLTMCSRLRQHMLFPACSPIHACRVCCYDLDLMSLLKGETSRR